MSVICASIKMLLIMMWYSSEKWKKNRAQYIEHKEYWIDLT